MKHLLIHALLAVLVVGFTSFKPTDDLKVDRKRIIDKDYMLTYVKVVYYSSEQYAIDTKVKIYNTNDGARTFSKKV